MSAIKSPTTIFWETNCKPVFTHRMEGVPCLRFVVVDDVYYKVKLFTNKKGESRWVGRKITSKRVTKKLYSIIRKR